MKIQTLIFLLVMGCFSSLSFNIAINQSAIAQTASQIRKMRAVGVPVVLPSYIPNGFRLTSSSYAPSSHSYDAIYKGPNNCKISVNGADGGWGAPGPVRQWTVNTKLFGKVILEEWDAAEMGTGVHNYLMADATPNGPGRGRIKGFPNAGYIFIFSCDHSVFSHQTASRILQSAQLVK